MENGIRTDSGQDAFNLEESGIILRARLSPWDSLVFGCNVAEIFDINVSGDTGLIAGYARFEEWLDHLECGIVSCRLEQGKLPESMFLENHGFRFVETVLHPRFSDLQRRDFPDPRLIVEPALGDDISKISEIARKVFREGRYQIDPRIDTFLADLRYANWVENADRDDNQEVYKITEGSRIVSFFVTGEKSDSEIHWYLVAVIPELQGMGYGRRACQAMLRHHRNQRKSILTTTIATSNIRMLNLCGSLDFLMTSPEMTFHWIRNQRP